MNRFIAKSTANAATAAAASEKAKALQVALAQIEKQFGRGSVIRLGEKPKADVACIPTGSIALDMALGIGGVPRGRITEIYGAESSGKTTLAMHILASAQRMGGEAAFTKLEGSTSWFFPLPWSTVFHIKGAAGKIYENEDGKLPVYEHFYLGGLNSIRVSFAVCNHDTDVTAILDSLKKLG